MERARLLFVGSNPSIAGAIPQDPDHAADKPHLVTPQRSDDSIVERFENAFSHYMEDGTRALGESVTSYWAWVKGRAVELLPPDSVDPGEAYAITEVVRCKSKKERGADGQALVAEARETCSTNYLERTLALSPARVVVGVGATR